MRQEEIRRLEREYADNKDLLPQLVKSRIIRRSTLYDLIPDMIGQRSNKDLIKTLYDFKILGMFKFDKGPGFVDFLDMEQPTCLVAVFDQVMKPTDLHPTDLRNQELFDRRIHAIHTALQTESLAAYLLDVGCKDTVLLQENTFEYTIDHLIPPDILDKVQGEHQNLHFTGDRNDLGSLSRRLLSHILFLDSPIVYKIRPYLPGSVNFPENAQRLFLSYRPINQVGLAELRGAEVRPHVSHCVSREANLLLNHPSYKLARELMAVKSN